MPLTLEIIRTKKEKQKKALEEALEEIRKKLATMGVLKIILFGSLAHGRVSSTSDLDLICLMPSNRTGKEWMKKIHEEIDWQVGCDLLAYTEEELKKTLPLSRFLRHAIKTGKVIYESRP